jgi:hypothetical protein
MIRRIAVAVAALAVLSLAPRVEAANYVLHFQGRSQGSWHSTTSSGARMPLADVASRGWTNLAFAFDGNARITSVETDSPTRVGSVNHALRTYCGTGTGNACIVHCYSVGCYRALKAIDDIRAGAGGSADSLAGLLYMEGSGSAAGGTDLAELATGLFTGWLAKLLGQQEAIDFDLTRSAARTNYAYIHDAMPVQFWHVDGNQEICKKLLGFIKICSGGFIAGSDDGVVPWASSGGFASSAARTSLCSGSASDELNLGANVPGKYPKHRTDVKFVDCDGTAPGASTASWDHFGIVDVGEKVVEANIRDAETALYGFWKWSDAITSEAACDDDGSCDNAFASTTSTDFTRFNDGTPTASASVDARTSPTYGVTGSPSSCAGRCGSAPPGWCGCQAGSSDRCGDYNAANCPSVNR